MHTGTTVVGVILLISGAMVALSGVSMMNAATTETWLGTVGDENDYNNGLMVLAMGGILAFIGFIIMVVGLTGKDEPKPVVVQSPPPYQYSQPMYPPQPGPYTAQPPPQYYPPPPQQQAPPPVYPQHQQPIQQVAQPPQQAPPQAAPQVKVQPIVCGECGKANPVSAKFCNDCGKTLGK